MQIEVFSIFLHIFTYYLLIIFNCLSQQKILEEARRSGLVELFTSVGLSDEEQKNSFDYLGSLGDNSQAHLTVDFDQLIMGPTKLP